MQREATFRRERPRREQDTGFHTSHTWTTCLRAYVLLPYWLSLLSPLRSKLLSSPFILVAHFLSGSISLSLCAFLSPCVFIRGNSLETPNVWGLSSFHPEVWKQPPPPQCLTIVLFSPRLFYRAEMAATWTPHQQLTGRGSHVAAMSPPGKTKTFLRDCFANAKRRMPQSSSPYSRLLPIS